jgi:hypothetical protein
VDLGRPDGDHGRGQTHAERERTGIDISRAVHAVWLLPHGRPETKRWDDATVPEPQVLLAGLMAAVDVARGRR